MAQEKFTLIPAEKRKNGDLPYLQSYQLKELDTNGAKNKITVVTTPDESEFIIGALVTIDGRRHFIDRASTATDEEVKASLQNLASQELTFKDLRVHVAGTPIIQLGNQETAPPVRGGALTITGEIETGSQLKAMKDTGSLEKTNWRFHMLDFARRIFPKAPPKDSAVVLFPGASDVEYSLWHSFGFSYDDMVMIESDDVKARQLREKFGKEKKQPAFVHARFGGDERTFSNILAQEVGGRPISVLSLDTESLFSPQLYDDLVSFFAEAEFPGDVCFSINLVARTSLEVCREFLVNASQRTGIQFPISENPRHDLVTYLPQILLHDAERNDLVLREAVPGTYLGNNAVTMEYIFAHFASRKAKP